MDTRVVAELAACVGSENVLTSPQDLICYGFDATGLTGRPSAVVLPRATAEVSRIMKIAYRERIPVTPRGAGTGLAGGAVPVQGGVVLSLARMTRIVETSTRDRLAVVEPGVITADLARAAEAVGLFYPPDPSSHKVSTIGGNIACNAGGPRCFKYGVTRDYVLGLEVVLPDGDVLRTGGRTVKNVTGYDLTRLIVGSEGTLGVVTQANLRLIAQPEVKQTLLAVFSRLDAAGRAVEEVVSSGVVPCSMELMDQACLQVVEQYLGVGLPVDAEAVLLVELDGYRETVERQAAATAALLTGCDAAAVRVAHSEAEAANLWQARRSISPALTRIAPLKIGEDIAVPPSQIQSFIRRFQYLRQQFEIPMVVYGHAGDGNLHPNTVVDGRNPAALAEVERWLGEVARLALDLGGTLSGEHGIGALKAPYLEWEVGAVGIQAMRAIKTALDPLHLLNPGKMRLDDGGRAVEQ